jgi:hypothetical protein
LGTTIGKRVVGNVIISRLLSLTQISYINLFIGR